MEINFECEKQNDKEKEAKRKNSSKKEIQKFEYSLHVSNWFKSIELQHRQTRTENPIAINSSWDTHLDFTTNKN